MRKFRQAALALATVFGLSMPVQAADVPNVVTIVTSPHPETQLMAMVLTMQSVKKGATAHILLCGQAGDMALKKAPQSVTAPQKPKGMSPQGLMKRLMERTGTPVQVCALYLPNKGIGQPDLLDGITPAKPPAMADRLLADNTRVLSF